MSKEMRRLIDTFNQHIIKESKKSKYQLSIDRENERLLNLYPNLKFSDKWNSEMIPRYMEISGNSFEEEYNKWKIYYTKSLLEPFDIFYKKYRPDEQQMDNLLLVKVILLNLMNPYQAMNILVLLLLKINLLKLLNQSVKIQQ